MIVFIYLLVAILAFLVGYLLAGKTQPEIIKKRKKDLYATTEISRREYENFLNYDGSEQL